MVQYVKKAIPFLALRKRIKKARKAFDLTQYNLDAEMDAAASANTTEFFVIRRCPLQAQPVSFDDLPSFLSNSKK